MSLKEKGAERAKLERLLIAVLALGLFAAVAAYAVCFYGFKDNSYTQEAAYRIDCMCEKLGLSCLRGFNPAEDYGDLCRRESEISAGVRTRMYSGILTAVICMIMELFIWMAKWHGKVLCSVRRISGLCVQ